MIKKHIERLFVVAMCILAIDHDAMAQKSIEELVKSNVIATQVVQSSCDVRHASYENQGFPGGAPVSWQIVRQEWTGGCRNGKLDGEGTITLERIPSASDLEMERREWQKFTGTVEPIPKGSDLAMEKRTTHKYTGLMIEGRKVGPWLIAESSFLNGLYSWDDAVVPGLYRKEPNGAFQHVDHKLQPIASSGLVSAEQVAQHIRAAKLAAGDGSEAPSQRVAFQSALLQDLTRGAQVFKAPTRSLGEVRTKRVLLVLSSNTLASLDRMQEFQRTLLDWASRQNDPQVRNAAGELAQAADKQKLAADLTAALRAKFANVSVAEDLTSFSKKDTDLIVIFDFSFDHRVKDMLTEQIASSAKTYDQIRKEFKLIMQQQHIAPAVFVSASHFILNSNLEVVRSQINNPHPIAFGRAVKADSFVQGKTEKTLQAEGLIAAFKASAEVLRAFVGDERRLSETASVLYYLRSDLNTPD